MKKVAALDFRLNPPIVNKRLAAALRDARRKSKLSQRALAAKAGLHLMTVQRAEAGQKIGLTTLRCLAEALDLDLRRMVSLAA